MTNPPTSTAEAAEQPADPGHAAFAAWVEQNPIRVWRHSRDPHVPLHEAASRLGVGMSMIQMYERGVHRPGPSRKAQFAAVLGESWASDWDTWLKNKPTA